MSATMAVVLMVAVVVVIGAVVVFLTGHYTKQQDPPAQRVTWIATTDPAGGGIIEVQRVAAPTDWSRYAASGTATCDPLPSGEVRSGQTLRCSTNGTFNLVDLEEDRVVYMHEFT